MNQDRINAERADIERRVANFRDMQARFQRDREAYYESMIERVRSIDDRRRQQTVSRRFENVF